MSNISKINKAISALTKDDKQMEEFLLELIGMESMYSTPYEKKKERTLELTDKYIGRRDA